MNGGKLTEWVLAGIYHLIITVSAILHIGCQIMPDHLYFVWYVMGIHVKGTLAKKDEEHTHVRTQEKMRNERKKHNEYYWHDCFSVSLFFCVVLFAVMN